MKTTRTFQNYCAALALSVFALSIGACNSDSHEVKKAAAPQPGQVSMQSGSYVADLQSVNAWASTTTGTATIEVKDDLITVDSEYSSIKGGMEHMQFITTGTQCPGVDADKNHDGVIDAEEAAVFIGGLMIPLDGDLNSQAAGYDQFPTADQLDTLTYKSDGRVSSLLKDLSGPSTESANGLVKMQSSALDLEGKAVVVYGIGPTVNVLPTVKGLPNATPQASLLIACGILKKVTVQAPEAAPAPTAVN